MIGLDAWYEILFALLVGHALADYPLQGEFLAKAKNRFNPIPGVPWYHAMGAHALIHGGMVFVITGSVFAALAETVSHFLIDDEKCAGRFSFNEDQVWHFVAKGAALASWNVGVP